MNWLRYITSVVLLVLLNACTPEEWTEIKTDNGMKPASLTLSLSSFGVSVGTRGLENPDSDPTTWTPMERAADGREIYRLTAFLINKENTLVAYRDIYYSDPKTSDVDTENGFWDGAHVGQKLAVGQQVKLSFNYDVNKHGKIEKLVQGEYTLIAVANYSPYEEYKGLKTGTADFTAIVQNIINNFNGDTGIATFDRTNHKDFFNFHLDAGTDFICPKNQPQPLTLVKKIHLLPGNNQVTGELKRTYARIRIILENQSKTYLTNSSLTFDPKFAKRYAYLLEDPNNPNFTYPNNQSGAPVATSKDAITPYAPSVLGQENTVLLDAYILESKGNESDFSYTLNVKYGDDVYSILRNEPISEVDTLNKYINMENTNFLIKRSYQKQATDATYISYSGYQVTPVDDKTSLKSRLWTVQNNQGQYAFKSYETNSYIGNIYEQKGGGWFLDPYYLSPKSSISLTGSPAIV